jgi:hypothetical protein
MLFRLRPLLCAFLLLALLFSCSGKKASFNFDASSLAVYVAPSDSSGLSLSLSRDADSVFGSWEESASGGVAGNPSYGLVQGSAKADGSLELRLFGASSAAPARTLKGSYSDGERRIEATLIPAGEAESAGRSVSLEADAKAVKDLSVLRLHLDSRVNLVTSDLDPTRFRYLGLEPSGPAALRSWYRGVFQGGLSLKDAMDKEGKAFIGDYETRSAQLKDQYGQNAIHAWYYEGRQFLAHRSGSLFVMGLRRETYTGGQKGSAGLAYAVIDLAQKKVLGPGDFLAAGWEEKLPALLEKSARASLGVAAGLPLSGVGFSGEEIAPNGNFFVYSGGIGFHYTAGEIADAALGDLSITVPLADLGELLSPGAAARLAGGK